MNPILAEATNQFMGALVYAGIAIIGGILAVVTIWALTRKKSTVEIEPQPIETRRAPKRFAFEFWDERHHHLADAIEKERIAREEAIAEIQRQRQETLATIRKELEDGNESRKELHKRVNRISVGVARLCGKLNVAMPGEDAEI